MITYGFPFQEAPNIGPQELAYLRTGEAPAPARDYWCYKVGVETRSQALARSGYYSLVFLLMLADAFLHLQ